MKFILCLTIMSYIFIISEDLIINYILVNLLILIMFHLKMLTFTTSILTFRCIAILGHE